MRQWMVDPRYMCDRHLLGEHVEHHMFVGTINKGTSIQGYIDNNLLEPKSLKDRHLAIATEMIRRGMNHKTDLPQCNIERLSEENRKAKIDRDRSFQDLMSRCPKCREKKEQNDRVMECIERQKNANNQVY